MLYVLPTNIAMAVRLQYNTLKRESFNSDMVKAPFTGCSWPKDYTVGLFKKKIFVLRIL